MGSVNFVNGHWFAYTDERVLGPFNSRRQAIRALIREAQT